MNFKLTQKQIEDYRRLGAICLRSVFDVNWVNKVTKGIDKNFNNPSPFGEKLSSGAGDGVYFNDYCNWRSIPEFTDYVQNSPAAEIAGQLMESETAVFYHEHVLIKEAGTSKETPWHADQAYYPIDGNQVCSIWMPVDPVGLETTIQFVAGSHKWPNYHIPRKFATSLNYESLRKMDAGTRKYVNVPSDETLRRDNHILQWEVNPGDCIVFHMKTLHGAPGNTSSRYARRILSTRWLGDDAVMADRPWNVSPPILGGLQIGDRAVSPEFPIIWRSVHEIA